MYVGHQQLDTLREVTSLKKTPGLTLDENSASIFFPSSSPHEKNMLSQNELKAYLGRLVAVERVRAAGVTPHVRKRDFARCALCDV